MNLNKLTPSEQEELLALMEQKEREKVTPLCEQFRDSIIGGNCDSKYRVRGVRGGRGAAGKSHSLVSLLVQTANVRNDFNVACFREVQNSIEESVYRLIQQKIEFLHYTDWSFTKTKIQGPLIDGKRSSFIFKGLKDTRSATNIKSLENYNVYFIEEASSVSLSSLDTLMPTLMRQNNPRLYFCYNPNLEDDPISIKIWEAGRDDALLLTARAGKLDNPWFPDSLVEEMEHDKQVDYDQYLHTWCGEPYSMGDSAILSRPSVQAAMERGLLLTTDNQVPLTVGADIARFGSDRTCIIVRRGMKVVDIIIGKHWDTMLVANKCRSAGKNNPTTIYNIDGGAMGPGVIDKLRELGEKHVNEINFGSEPHNKEKYVNKISEMWFNLSDLIDDIDIPNNSDLKSELCSRQFNYDNRGRKIVESKKDYKKRRAGVSPDLADALLLCYYGNQGGEVSSSIQDGMRARRGL